MFTAKDREKCGELFDKYYEGRKFHDTLWDSESYLPGIDLNESAQLALLQDVFPQYQNEYTKIPSQPTGCFHDFYFANGHFSGTDALVLYCMIRYFGPLTRPTRSW